MVKETKQEKVLQEIKEQLKRLSPAKPNWYYPPRDKEQTYWRLYEAGKYYIAVGVYHDLAGRNIIFDKDGEIIYDYKDYSFDYRYFTFYHKTKKPYKAEMKFVDTIFCDYENMKSFVVDEFGRVEWF